IAHKYCQRREFSHAGSASAPCSFKNSRSPSARGVEALADIIVAARGQKARIFAHCRFIGSRLGDAEPDLRGHREPIEYVPASPDAGEIGAAVDRSPLVV